MTGKVELDAIRAAYLDRLKVSLGRVSADVRADVEREISAHIDDAVTARGASTPAQLREILERLGPPEAYARDLALYRMVDRGYRDWSVPHMLRSAMFWARGTVGGAIVVSAFAVLYLWAAVVVVAGVAGVAGVPRGFSDIFVAWLLQLPMALITVGGLSLIGLTAMVRWFVGQYVARAQPEAVEDGQAPDWAARASRRIVTVAVVGGLVAVGGAIAAGVVPLLRDLATGPDAAEAIPALPIVFRSPPGQMALAGALAMALSPVIGLLWTLWVERGSSAETG